MARWSLKSFPAKWPLIPLGVTVRWSLKPLGVTGARWLFLITGVGKWSLVCEAARRACCRLREEWGGKEACWGMN